MSHRFTIASVLLIVCLAAPSWADFQAGLDALDRGNYGTALKELRPLAERGNADAQSLLGMMYEEGKGVPQDYQQAANWYRWASEQGNDRGQEFLAGLYLTGTGVPQDYVLAHMWGNLAAVQGNAIGAYIRDQAATKMAPVEIAEAQKLARGWKPKGK